MMKNHAEVSKKVDLYSFDCPDEKALLFFL